MLGIRKNTDISPTRGSNGYYNAPLDERLTDIAFADSRTRLRPLAAHFGPLRERIWNASHAPSTASFAQRLRRLREWASAQLTESPMKAHVLNLCEKQSQFSRAYDHDKAHRTRNRVDRLMRFLDRACFYRQYFHAQQS